LEAQNSYTGWTYDAYYETPSGSKGQGNKVT